MNDQRGIVVQEFECGLFPLPDVVLFPTMRLPLQVFEPRYRRLVADALSGDALIALPRLKAGYELEYYEAPAVFSVCGVGSITEHRKLSDGRYHIVVEGITRARLLEEVAVEPYRRARYERLNDETPVSLATANALREELVNLLRLLDPHLSEPSFGLQNIVRNAPNAGQCSDALSSILVSDPDARQRLLEELDPLERLATLVRRLHDLLLLAGADAVPKPSLN